MITTRQVNVKLNKGKLKLRHVTTKHIDASVRVEPPKGKIKPRSITTTTLPDVADIAEKKRRDDIAKEKKLAMKNEKKIVIAEEKVTPIIKIDDEDFLVNAGSEPNKEIIELVKSNVKKAVKLEEKKPWNKMNAKERKEYQIEKARKKK